jgi:ABC-type multidrug transport system fused ATPase/permease subunit
MGENHVTQIKCLSVALLTLALEAGVVFYYVAARRHAGEAIMIGSVTAIFQYLSQLMEAFQFYAGDYEDVIHWKADFEAIRPALDATPRISATTAPDLGEWERLAIGPIRFAYGDGAFRLEEVSLNLGRASKIALVGESGSGKSTLLHILRGLTEVPDARLTTDGGASLPLAALSNATTLIPQEPEIFENTLRYNVTMGIPATDDEIGAAVRTAGFEPVVANQPKGLETDIREKGVNLSGGERQRLALARGALAIRDSRIVLLDEPTSNVDPGTERAIFARLFETLDDRCVIASIHRLHLARLFDSICVMKRGRIVEEGTFEELVGQNGEFARLWATYQAEEEFASAS